MNQYLIAALWAVVGAAAGFGVRRGSVVLARLEELEPGSKWWQEYGPPVVAGIAFAVYGYEISSFPLLLVRSVFVLALVQVIFFDFEHHLILDRVLFPAMAFALLVTLTPLLGSRLGLWEQSWWMGIAMGVAAGALFLFISFLGAMLFKSEALGFGDVKFAVFLGLLLGWPYTFTALFYGVILAAAGAFVFIVTHRSMKGTIAYGPYLALGAMAVLLQMP